MVILKIIVITLIIVLIIIVIIVFVQFNIFQIRVQLGVNFMFWGRFLVHGYQK